ERCQRPRAVRRHDHARRVLRARQPDERAGDEPLHRGVAGVRPGRAAAARHPGRLGALVHQRDGGDRDAASAHHPRLLRLPPGAVRRRLPRAGTARARGGGERRGLPDLGRRRRRLVGHRPRHVVGAGARLPGRVHPGRAAVHQRRQAVRLPPRPRSAAGSAARAGGAGRRQRQRRAQPRRDAPGARRRGLRLGSALRRGRSGADAHRPGRGRDAGRAPRLPDRRADPRPLPAAALPRRTGQRRTLGGGQRTERPRGRLRVRQPVHDRLHRRDTGRRGQRCRLGGCPAARRRAGGELQHL
ncbi:MAG: FIG074102: hypothetical protein, partial [uncultured Frankineae bacterium]